MAKNILKEAIADAKAVREVALANAKAALEEAFTPKLQNMLSAKLSEELEEDYYDEDEDIDMDEMMNFGESEEENPFNPLPETESPMGEDDLGDDYEGDDEDLDEEIDLEEILNELELEVDDADEKPVDEGETTDDDEDVDLEEILKPHYEAGDVNIVNPSADNSNLGYVHEDKEFDLNALLKEINDLEDDDEEIFEIEDDESNEPPTAGGAPAPITGGQKEIGDVVTMLLPMIGVPAAKYTSAGGNERLKEVMSQATSPSAKLKAFTSFLSELGGDDKESSENDESTSSEKDAELKETKAALEIVKSELNEVNLLNSKLLYVNRIFKANNLDDSQKLRVVETLDKAESAKEAKLIYETIKDTFNVAKSRKVSKHRKTKSLKENFRGMASKATVSTAPKRKDIISESNDMVNRFQKLANIKINQ